jgi:hypothetical protein
MPTRISTGSHSELGPYVRRFLAGSARLAAVLLGAQVVGASMAPALHAQSDEQAVNAVALRFFDGMRTRDTAMMRSTVLPSAVLVSVGDTNDLARTRPIDQFIQRVGAGTGVPGDERIKDPKIQIDGPLASLWAYFTYSRNGAVDHCGVDLFLMRKGPTGGWKVFYLADTHRTQPCPAITP